MGDFFGLQIGVSSLFAHRRALEISGSNIANANTDGYSRQRVNLVEQGAQNVPAIHAKATSQSSGVAASGAQRMRDMFLEARAGTEHGTEARLNKSQSLLNRIEGIFNEPSDNGLQAQLSDFWAGWEDLANNTGNLAARSQLLQRGGTLVNGLNQAQSDLANLFGTSVEQLKTVVTGINATADRLAELNGSILRATADGNSPNDLLDRRDSLVAELGTSAGVSTTTRADGQMDVYINGTAIVRGDQTSHIGVTVAPGTNVSNANMPGFGVGISWVKDGYPATITNGEVGGILDGLNRMMPAYHQGIGAVATQLANEVNAQHNQGIDLNGVQPGTVTGVPQAGITITAGVNDQFTVDLGPGPPAPITITLAAGAYAANATDAAALKADLQTKLNAAFGGPPSSVLADVRVAAGNLQVFLTSAAPGRTITTGNGGNNALPSLGVANGATAATDTVFDFTPGTGVMRMAVTDPTKLAAAMPGAGVLDGGNALNVSALGSRSGGADDSYRNFIIGVGVETQATTRRVGIQHSIVTQLDAQREAEAGVSLDEEMANLMMYQRGYEAAARIITTVDGMLDTLINSTGLVGRR